MTASTTILSDKSITITKSLEEWQDLQLSLMELLLVDRVSAVVFKFISELHDRMLLEIVNDPTTPEEVRQNLAAVAADHRGLADVTLAKIRARTAAFKVDESGSGEIH